MDDYATLLALQDYPWLVFRWALFGLGALVAVGMVAWHAWRTR